MTRAGRIVLAALAIATLGAGFVVQRVKDAPGVLRGVRVTPVFSPNGDGYRDVARIRFRLGRPDVVSVTIVDARGAAVRHLVTDRHVPADRRVRLRWNGRTDAGTRAAPGTYRVRVTLRRRGRTVDLRRATRLSARPPHGRSGGRAG